VNYALSFKLFVPQRMVGHIVLVSEENVFDPSKSLQQTPA
jgi:hypothetical protein